MAFAESAAREQTRVEHAFLRRRRKRGVAEHELPLELNGDTGASLLFKHAD
jgi:hypothetical protein